jgi:hypothetical protein
MVKDRRKQRKKRRKDYSKLEEEKKGPLLNI